MFTPFGFSGTFGGGAGVSEDTRVDDNIKWTKKYGNLNVGFAYKVGGMAGDNNLNTGEQVNVGYDDGGFGVQVLWEQHNDALKLGGQTATTPGIPALTVTGGGTTTSASNIGSQLKGTLYNTSDYLIAFKAKVGDGAAVKAGYQVYTLSNPYGITAGASAGNINAYGYTVAASANATADQIVSIAFLGGSFDVTKKLNVAVGYYYTDYASYGVPSAGTTTAGGNQSAVSFLMDCILSKNTDSYLGAMYNTVNGVNGGTNTATYKAQDQLTVGVGLRHKF
jgi:hypothetical protein